MAAERSYSPSTVPVSTKDGTPGSASSAVPRTLTSDPKVQFPATDSRCAARREGTLQALQDQPVLPAPVAVTGATLTHRITDDRYRAANRSPVSLASRFVPTLA